ncbi:S9 family peptidase [Homoserinibacter sp. YIM 151385]|uniref:S9 family peptidase n=1 Tax=Homoserinibacter sp. YIM 151385 TaxID=2985506 RepID=UPI0022F0434D|nr:S9 family peptidase [Homoserinibacter sp. YIM 151385]WBU38540.1 S9 family peptidase [Homoserinibacter sp. YIM 151385]
MRAADLELLTTVGLPSLHPDGSWAVVATSRPDLDADANVGQLWSVALEGGAPRRLTRGRADRSPAFSPDGSAIAFLRPVDGRPQLHLLDARGGEPLAITAQPLGVSGFTWSPDGARIVFAARVPEPGRYGTVEGLAAEAEPARRFTALGTKSNGLGWSRDRRTQLFVLEVPSLDAEPHYDPAPRPGDEPSGDAASRLPEARQLTFADADHASPALSPDGSRVAFIASLHDSREDDLRSDVWELPIDADESSEPRRRTDEHPLSIVDLLWGPDDRLWFIAQDLGPTALDFVARNAALHLVDGERVTRLTDPDAHDLAEIGAHLSQAGPGAVLAQDRVRGRVPLLRIDDAGRVEVLAAGDIEVSGHASAGEAVVVALAAPDSLGELARVEPDGRLTRLTDFGAAARSTGLVAPVELEVVGRSGHPVHGWVAIPPGEGPHPVLLNIHGGPFASYGVHLFDETQVYVDAGYAVVYGNPRGSAGYGQAHGRAIKEAMGTVDLDDVLDLLDGAVAAHPELDGERTAVLGGSYGGYLTAWTIAHDHRFRAAVVERGFLDPEVFIGTSDIGGFFADEYTGREAAHRATQSPQAVVDQVTTPTLVLHSELDLRCPLSQAERYYSALKRNGVETELVVFPGEDHELSRAGRPRHRLERFEIILEWLARYIPAST